MQPPYFNYSNGQPYSYFPPPQHYYNGPRPDKYEPPNPSGGHQKSANTLFVKYLPYEMSTEDVTKLFEFYGEVATVKSHSKERGTAFITYYDMRAAENAQHMLHGHLIGPKQLVIDFSYLKNNKSNLQYLNFVVIEPYDPGKTTELDKLQDYLQQYFGQIYKAYEIEHKKFFVEFYDLRPAQKLIRYADDFKFSGIRFKISFPDSIPEPPDSQKDKQQYQPPPPQPQGPANNYPYNIYNSHTPYQQPSAYQYPQQPNYSYPPPSSMYLQPPPPQQQQQQPPQMPPQPMQQQPIPPPTLSQPQPVNPPPPSLQQPIIPPQTTQQDDPNSFQNSLKKMTSLILKQNN